MTHKNSISTVPSRGIKKLMALLVALSPSYLAIAQEYQEFFLLGTNRTRELAFQFNSVPPVPLGVFSQKFSIVESTAGIVSIAPGNTFYAPVDYGTVGITGLKPGRTTLTPNSRPETAVSVTVVGVDAQTIDGGCEDQPYYRDQCGATNLSGKCGTLQVTVTPSDQPIFLSVDDDRYVVTGSMNIPLNKAGLVNVAAYLDDPSRNMVYNNSFPAVYGGSCGKSQGDSCCGCANCDKGAGIIKGGLNSAWFSMSLGWSASDRSDGEIYFHKPTGPLKIEKSDFKVIAPSSTQILYDQAGLLSMLFTATHSFTLDYTAANRVRIDVIDLIDQTLVARCTVSNPDGDTNRLEIAGGRISQEKSFGFNWDPLTKTLSFRQGASNDADQVAESLTVYTNENALTIDRRLSDVEGKLLRYTTTTYTNIGGIRLPIQEIEHVSAIPTEGDYYHTTYMEYFQGPDHPGSYRKLAARWKNDGFFESYEYDEKGRVIVHRSPWQQYDVRLTRNSYAPVSGSGDNGAINSDALRTVIVEVDGRAEIEREYTAYLPEQGQPQQYRVIRERAATAGAAYGASGNLRDEAVYWLTNAPAHLQGRPVLVIRADGGRTRYEYETGYLRVSYNSTNPPASDMVFAGEAPGTPVLRTLAISGTADYPDGLPNQTVVERSFVDLDWGSTYMNEQFVYTGEGELTNETKRISRTLTFYNDEHRPILILNADGTYKKNYWGCCGLDSETGRDGISTDYTYDGQKRLAMRSDTGMALLPGSSSECINSYKYDALGRVVETTRSASNLTSLSSSTEYDMVGDNTVQTDEAGIVNETETCRSSFYSVIGEYGDYETYRYAYCDGTVFYEESFFDNRMKERYFDRYYDQGYLNEYVRDWGGWHIGPAEWRDVSQRRTDFLGRTDYEAVPAYGGAWRVKYHNYDAAGRLNNTTVETGSSISERTIYQYDALGNLALTCQDIDLDGQVDLDGPDRVSGQFSHYEYRPTETIHGQAIDAGWWHVSGSFVYPEENGSMPLTNGLSRTRISGLGQTGTYGLLTAETIAMDPNGNAILSREYMDRGAHRTVRWTRYSDSIQPEISFAIAGHTVSNVTRTGVLTRYEYDAFGRQTVARTETPGGARTVGTYTHYNNKGQIDLTKDAAGNRTSYAYDEKGRRIRTTDPMNQITETYYSGDGQVLATVGSTYPVAYEYDVWGRLVAMATTRDPTYANDNLWYLLEPDMRLFNKGASGYPAVLDTTLWYYDNPSGLLTSKVYADGQGPSYTYTPEGRLATRTWARGVTTSYSYDGAGALTAIDYSDDTPDVAFQYDRMGRQVSASVGGVSTNLYGYNLYGQLTNETVSLCAEPIRETFSRSYDTLGRETGFSLGGDYKVVYGYDEYGRFHSVSSSVASAASMNAYSYLAGSDLLAGLTNSSGFSWTRAFETNRNLIASIENRFGANMISRFDYDNDSLARRTRRVDNLTVTNDFGYNDRSEVIGALMGTNSYDYAYDPIGNRMTAANNGEALTYHANLLNQYTVISNGATIEPQYDEDGNMNASGDGWTYVWNADNRMILASNGTTVVSNAYDHQGRRVAKTVNGAVRQYLWDGWNMVADARASETNWYVWGLDLSQSLQGAGGVGGLLYGSFGSPNSATNACFTYDGNGNVSELVGTNGTTLAHYEYDPFGNLTTETGSMAAANPFRFSSKYWDSDAKLAYYGYRYYSPGMGRWLSRDPIGEQGGMNLYALLRNQSLDRVDYLGLFDLYGYGLNLDRGSVGHLGIVLDDGARYDYGRYHGKYLDSKEWGLGPNILRKDSGIPVSSAERSVEAFHFNVCPKLDKKIREKFVAKYTLGTATLPATVLEKLPSEWKAPLGANERYMGSDWSLADNCVSFTLAVVLEAAGEIAAEKPTSENARSQREAKELTRLITSKLLVGRLFPGVVLDEIRSFSSGREWVTEVDNMPKESTSDDKTCCGSGS